MLKTVKRDLPSRRASGGRGAGYFGVAGGSVQYRLQGYVLHDGIGDIESGGTSTQRIVRHLRHAPEPRSVAHFVLCCCNPIPAQPVTLDTRAAKLLPPKARADQGCQ